MEPPEDRCGFVLTPEEVYKRRRGILEVESMDIGSGWQVVALVDCYWESETIDKQEWNIEYSAFSCCREVWKNGRCIWHAQTKDKPVAELKRERENEWERLDCAVLSESTIQKEISFQNCSLMFSDFSGADLQGSDFTHTLLREVNLWGADLTDANLREADLTDAFLAESDLSHAYLRGADLPNATLKKADLIDAELQKADLTDAKLWRADFTDADLWRTDLTDTDFQETSLADANLRRTNLTNANLKRTNLSNADFWRADLPNADLREADLPNADLREADLPNATLKKCNLTDADIREANLIDADLREADLPNATLKEANLWRSDFREANLTDADVKEADVTDVDARKANFTDADFQKADLWRADFREANLTDVDFREANLTDTDFREADLTGVAINYTNLEEFTFDAGTTFGGRSQWETPSILDFIFGGPWYLPPLAVPLVPLAVFVFIPLGVLIQPFTSPDKSKQAELQYRVTQSLLREDDHCQELPELAVREKDARRKRMLAERRYWDWFKLAVYRWPLGYGEKPKHVVGTSILVIVMSALLYPRWGLVISKNPPKGGTIRTPFISYSTLPDVDIILNTLISSGTLPSELVYGLGKSLYFSVITFTTLGYGDIQPVGFGETLAIVESFLGALLMAFLVFILGRRTTW